MGKRAWPLVIVGEALALADAVGQVLVVPVVHDRLVVEEVHLRRAADHVQIDDVLGLGDVVLQPRHGRPGQGVGGLGLAFAAEERGEGGPADGVGALLEEIAAGDVGFERRREGSFWASYLFSTSSRFISSLAIIVQAASQRRIDGWDRLWIRRRR